MANIIPLPTTTFQAPGFVKPNDYSGLASSIDSLFTAYQQGQSRSAQLQALQAQTQGVQNANATNTANFQANNSGLTPQRFSAGLDQAQSFYAQPQNQAQPATPFLSPDPNSGQPAQPAPNLPAGDAATAFHVMQLHLMAQGLSAQEAQAQLANTLATGEKTQAETQKLQNENNLLSGSDGIVGNLTKQIRAGNMAPDFLNSMGRGDLANSVKLGVVGNLAANGDPVQALQNVADKSHATATYEGGPEVQGKVRTAKSISADANVLGDLASKLGKNDWQVVNKLGLAVAAQRGNVPAQEILDQAKLVADRFQALVGGGSDAKLELGLNLFDAAKTPAQLQRSVARVNESLGNYSSSLQGQGTKKSDIPDANKKTATKWSGGTTHTYADGTKAEWNGKAWVKVQ